MSKFFINRPIVAMVIAILMVIVGAVTIATLPVAQFPNIAPPEIRLQASYVGADAKTLEEAVATPIGGADQRRGQHELHVFVKRHGQ
jgi:multidrug efflux pump subunit AcrB